MLKTMVRDLLHPSASEEKRKHKLKRLVQSPNSFFMDVKCPGCFNITTVFSHAQTTVLCTVLCQPTGGKARLTVLRGPQPRQQALKRIALPSARATRARTVADARRGVDGVVAARRGLEEDLAAGADADSRRLRRAPCRSTGRCERPAARLAGR